MPFEINEKEFARLEAIRQEQERESALRALEATGQRKKEPPGRGEGALVLVKEFLEGAGCKEIRMKIGKLELNLKW